VGQWHLSGNIMEGNAELTNNNWKGLDLSALPENARSEAMVNKAFRVEVDLPAESAKNAYISVVTNAGATLPKRDGVDERIVSETKKRTASATGRSGKPGIIDSPASVGGWDNYKTIAAPADSDNDGMPDDWEKKNKLNPNDSEDRNHVGQDGYTMLEQYLNFLIERK